MQRGYPSDFVGFMPSSRQLTRQEVEGGETGLCNLCSLRALSVHTAVQRAWAYIVALVAPPSSKIFCPTIKPACWLHRNAQAAPNSAGVP